ncbi:MAG: hypothetical protein PHU67_01335 [Sulfurovum sp.]|jgi:hypothetical protein|nr:hypothetical protein [Sulfurovum sp.]MDD3499356.1 hypothetical protein [Sulfurovum sp.]
MKKALLLSVVASSMIMAGGDIAPVEPVVETPAPVVSGWEFSGTATVYYQTDDAGISGIANADIFDQEASAADAGIQLRATNTDVFAGIGAGVEVNGLATLGLENWMVSNVMQTTNGNITGGWMSQAYLTYGFGNTSIKAGRQELPKALSPFAFSEDWNVFKNTFDAVLVVNSDLPDTTLVGAWVYGANVNGMHADMAKFGQLNEHDGVFMLTAQNKSIANLTLTGSWYYAPDYAIDDLNILWGDAKYDAGSFNVAIQGGSIMSDAFTNDTTAFGAMVGGSFGMINAHVAYANVNDGDLGMLQLGGTTSALYTETALDQVSPVGNALRSDMDKFVVAANADVLGGNLGGAYAYTDGTPLDTEVNEFNLVYSTNITDSLAGVVAYVYADVDGTAYYEDVNLIRVVAKYNF